MTKKTNRKKLTFIGASIIAFAFSIVAFVACSIIVDSISVNLSVEKQKINNQIAALEIQNKELSIEVNTMSEYTNVSAKIENEGMNSTHIINLGN